ncbi:peptide chain release factor N(5)-glutamine methyltransferase [Actinomyces sp. Z5]|uniref:peptide chain release factor N(5)-glutamine methyltransferase n=1 Tax=Actinomyces sp. Z5 TaxID=2250216 RepID=UPI000DCD4E93|nr:peptide chain release factor N(5)-glutamine methyltransferase [Actinomyces sp. Z5]RAX21942.1 peptide chain release factor N(5)-glutamine methyltransferase [Actinomyces sp. Z5]
MTALDRYALRRLVREAGQTLARAGVASPDVDARLLAEHLLGCPVLLADGAPEGFAPAYAELVERRAAREPLQHILGVMWFRGLEFTCRPGVFIVRPETEVVAGAAVDAARAVAAEQGRAPVVVDLCTGSGAIAVAVAAEVPTARVWAVEEDGAAVALARENCERLAPGRVEIIRGDVTDPAVLAELDGSVDVVVANPPYVPAGAVEDLETERHDPDLALYGGGADGLRLPLAVVERAAALLRPGGVLVMEHDPSQAVPLRAASREAGFGKATTGADLTGRGRFLRAVR